MNRREFHCRVDIVVVGVMTVLALVACATPRVTTPGAAVPPFPLTPCEVQSEGACAARFFANDQGIAERDSTTFPRHYLELWDPAMRQKDCQDMAGDRGCTARLAALSRYFNPNGRPADDRIGVALEGGGSKSSPFSLGVLAGLEESHLLQEKVDAISSVSGGSYAASFLFNRLYDKYTQAPDAGDYADWFRSCVPDEYAIHRYHPYFDELGALGIHVPNCGERCDEHCGDSGPIGSRHPKDFLDAYRFQSQVWRNPDVVMGDLPGGPKNPQPGSFPWAEVANTGLLLGESALMIPYQALARTVFRWPNNSSPTRFTYKNGLERQFGYSPHDWKAVDLGSFGGISADLNRAYDTEANRRNTRTMSALARTFNIRAQDGQITAVQNPAPLWIVGSSSPGSIGAASWIFEASRDPIRHQFELTPKGYGSGVYGYANISPRAGWDPFLGSTPNGMPIVDAVVSSAGFLDDDQSVINTQPLRFVANATQHVTDLTWYTEIPNFDAGELARIAQRISPYPFYMLSTLQESKAPYIHLHDGGNSEGSGVFPLLRRGYKTILFAQGGQDTQAQFSSICHLKNQLELDSKYFIVSPDLERVIRRFQPGGMSGSVKHFSSYLDQLCSEQLDTSDLAAYDGNGGQIDTAKRPPAVAKLICGRLGDPRALGDRAAPDPSYTPCPEFRHMFYSVNPDGTRTFPAGADPLPKTFVDVTDLFYRWTGASIQFLVYRGDALQYLTTTPPNSDLLSTILDLVPSISWKAVNAQLDGPAQGPLGPPEGNNQAANPWQRFCAETPEFREEWRIASCRGPNDKLYRVGATGQTHPTSDPVIPCTSLAYILATSCAGLAHPDFPQDNFVFQTWHTTYTMFGAYFDLGRRQACRAVDSVTATLRSHSAIVASYSCETSSEAQ
jgi:hypothetical protein